MQYAIRGASSLSGVSQNFPNVGIAFGALLFRTDTRNANPFVDFRLFRNMTYTGATLSNLLLNARGWLADPLRLTELLGRLT